MRATTRFTPKVSGANRAEMMLELSPDDTAAKASAPSIPAFSSTSRSNPKPSTRSPPNSGLSRLNAALSLSITATSWPMRDRPSATEEPTRPHPITTPRTRGPLGPPSRSGQPVWETFSSREPYRQAWLRLLLALVSKLSTAARRLVLGRPFRRDRLSHTLLPKRIALPVFASDALSSVAYAPEEVFLMLSVAGLAAYSLTPWIGVAVAAVMLTVVASYRQNVHAYPSGGGDYEVATVNLGPNAGLTVASALLVDYVLTVAVSVANGVDYVGATIPFVATHKPLVAIVIVVVLTLMNLRGIRESSIA